MGKLEQISSRLDKHLEKEIDRNNHFCASEDETNDKLINQNTLMSNECDRGITEDVARNEMECGTYHYTNKSGQMFDNEDTSVDNTLLKRKLKRDFNSTNPKRKRKNTFLTRLSPKCKNLWRLRVLPKTYSNFCSNRDIWENRIKSKVHPLRLKLSNNISKSDDDPLNKEDTRSDEIINYFSPHEKIEGTISNIESPCLKQKQRATDVELNELSFNVSKQEEEDPTVRQFPLSDIIVHQNKMHISHNSDSSPGVVVTTGQIMPTYNTCNYKSDKILCHQDSNDNHYDGSTTELTLTINNSHIVSAIIRDIQDGSQTTAVSSTTLAPNTIVNINRHNTNFSNDFRYLPLQCFLKINSENHTCAFVCFLEHLMNNEKCERRHAYKNHAVLTCPHCKEVLALSILSKRKHRCNECNHALPILQIKLPSLKINDSM